ncbi:MAG: chemotaxis protein CheW [Eubacteriales bacterium]
MQIIIFTLGEKYYAISTDEVDEISKEIPSTNVPNSPEWVEGLINLRGNVVSLVNLSKLLHQDDEQCYNNIIILNHTDEKIGLLVKDVYEVITIDTKEIQKITHEGTNSIIGIISLEGNIINIIDLDRLIQ